MIGTRIIWLLLVAVFLKQLVWVTFIPIWQTPDEQAHFSQVQNIAETSSLKPFPINLSREIWISEVILGTNRDDFGNNKFTYHPEFNISYSGDIVGPGEKLITGLPKSARTDYVKNEGTWYPAAYYLITGQIYRAVSEGTLFDRVFAVRLFSVVLMVTLVYVVYAIGRQLFPQVHLALVLSLLVGFHPMLSFVYTGVTSDVLFNLLFACFLFRCLILIKNGLTIRNLCWIATIIIFSFWTKPQANIMAFILVPLLTVLFVFQDRRSFKLFALSVLIVGLSLVGVGLRIRAGVSIFPETEYIESLNYSVFAIYDHLRFTLEHTYREVLPWYWGVFRWLSLGLPEGVRRITNALTLVSFVGFGGYLFVKLARRKFDQKTWMMVFCAFSLAIYFAAITVFDFGFRQAHGYSYGIQGRYFFPVIASQMVIFLVGLMAFFPDRVKLWGAIVLGAAMIGLNIFVLYWVSASYYATSWSSFFIQASQYKPLWLKFPINVSILTIFLVFSLVVVYNLCRRKLVSR